MSPRLRTLLMTSTALFALGSMPASAQPTGANVVGGNATVSGAGTNSVIVNQTSDRAIINWNTFNISSGGSATFNQPGSSSITLNRVTGGLGPSVIDGTITANGRVFIINRDGMLFGRGAVINTAGFLATTNDIRNADFMAGRMNFNIPGRGNASIVNYGTITASNGGFAALVAPGVRNSGTISAHLGTVALASGNSFTLDMYGDKLIQIAVGDQIADKVIDVATGKPLSSLVTNDGTLRANGGRVEITAAAARHIVDSVINNKGVIEANSVGTRGGRIVLGGATRTAGLPKQTIKISGKLSATGKNKGQKGGTIQITGEDIQFAAAMLDVSGHFGGGKILAGGDYGGGRPLPGGINNQSAALEDYAIPTASTVTVDSATTFNASATANGHGGKVILWSDVLTTFAGTIFARGGDEGGNGGFVEVSGKQTLAFSGLVNTLAPNGTAGTLLLDPTDMTVSTNPNSVNNINVSTLIANLEGGSVQISTSAPGDDAGNITIAAGVTWAANTTLSLLADSNININAPITAVNGGLTVEAGPTSTITTNANGAINVGTFTLVNGNWTQNAATLPAFQATNFEIQGGQFLRVTGGNGDNDPYQIADVYGLQGIGSSSSLLNQNYVLANNIDASVSANWNGGFKPIGNANNPFGGTIDGQNFTISGLTINPNPSVVHVGMIGYMDDGSVRDLKLTNVTIYGNANSQIIGGLVGEMYGTSFINNVTISGNIDAAAFNSITAGGLVGRNYGFISNAHATVNVEIGNGAGGIGGHERDAHAGGLVGHNYGIIEDSSASGTVRGGGNTLLGGLVGTNGDIENGYNNYGVESWGPTITNSFATGAVIAQTESPHSLVAAGGLVGDNWGRIHSSYATGEVAISGNIQIMAAGGLVGQQRDAYGEDAYSWIISSYASGNVSAASTYTGINPLDVAAGGLVGVTDSSTKISNVYALGNVTIAGVSTQDAVSLAAGGLIGRHFGHVAYAYSTGSATNGGSNTISPTYRGGSIGIAHNGSNIVGVYWDKGTSGTYTGIGQNNGAYGSPSGLQTEHARSQSTYAAFDFKPEGYWFMVEGSTRPMLRSEWSTTIRNTHQLQLMSMDLGANYVLANDINFAGQFGESGIWGSRGFSPVGYLGQTQLGNNFFTGSLNGQGFTINALMIAPNSATMQSVGLFSTIGEAGSVSNLNITNASVAANIGFQQPMYGPPVSQWVGVLAGQSGGTITNVTVTDSNVSGLSLSGVNAGGLVGQHGIIIQSNEFELPSYIAGTITNSHAINVNVAVAGGMDCSDACPFNAAGGLVGVNVAGSSIANSSSTGTVSGGAYTWAGGLVGQNGFFWPPDAHGTITNSFSTANVSVNGAQSAAGGLVGHNAPGSTITSSHATGNVSGTGGVTVGGLVGENHGTIEDSIINNVVVRSYATGAVTLSDTGASDAIAGGLAGTNQGSISNAYATGAVSSTNGDVTLGGFVGVNFGNITTSHATGNVTANTPTLAILGGFAGGNLGTITHSHATGNVVGNAALAIAGGFVGINIDEIMLSYATGNVSVGDNGFAGGFAGFNFGAINQAYARGAVVAGANGFAGGFVAANVAFDFGQNESLALAASAASPVVGSITQSYALGPVTGGNAAIAASFAALNLGSLDQVYGVGHVQGGSGSTLGGLVGKNSFAFNVPDLFEGPAPTFSDGTATSSYWDMQTTAQTTSAGGTGMNTAKLSSALPSGFDPLIWQNGSYPYLTAFNPNNQNTEPGPPVIPPVGETTTTDNLQPPDQQINANTFGGATSTTGDPVPNTTQFVQQQTQQQAQQQQRGGGSDPQTTGSILPGPQPIRLDVGDPDRYFYLPPPEETRLVVDEVVLQMPCNVPQAVIDGILKQHNLTLVASQCLSEGGNAAFRMRHASNQQIAAVIKALAAHQIIAAAQANYTYELAETSVQSATSQQGDPGQYITEKLRLFAAHRIVTGNGVPIGVVDSEIDGAHPDLTGAIVNRYDATGVEDNPHAHGTGMAGAIVSHQKLLGVAPGARILAVRAFSTRSTNPESTTYHILRGIDWAVTNNVRIINMSFAGPRDPSLERALKAAYDKGIVLIAAAGNAGPRSPALYPAADPNVIAVTATDFDDKLFAGANRGNHLAISAPGVDILVPAPAGEYQVTTGTSVATAHISGVVALMLERNAKLTPADVRKILTASAKRLGPANLFGAGLVDPIKAIEMATPRSAAAPRQPAAAAAPAPVAPAVPKRSSALPRPAVTVAARP